MRMILYTLAVTVAAMSLLSQSVSAKIIFQDNFDKQVNWTKTQKLISGADDCYPGKACDPKPPVGWSGYYDGFSQCKINAPGNNTLNINSINRRGETGKGLTIWNESCTDVFGDSDGDIGVALDAVYQELWVTFYIRFDPNWRFAKPSRKCDGSPTCSAYKLIRAFYWGNAPDTPYLYHDTRGKYGINKPISITDLQNCEDTFRALSAFRCEVTYKCEGDYGQTWGSGNFAKELGDGNWHKIEWYSKMNTNSGSKFNPDGINRVYSDGKLVFEKVDIYFSDPGSQVEPRLGFNYVAIGGNNIDRWSCTGDAKNSEQWYAIDDVVISTERLLFAPMNLTAEDANTGQ